MILLLLCGLLLAQIPSTQASAIQGIVVKAGTTDPVAKAAVVLRKAGGTESQTIITGADGRFSFQPIPAGRYTLAASRTGFLSTSYQQRGANRPGVPLTVNAGQLLNDVRLSMMPIAAISGIVSDPDGDPLPNVGVLASRYEYKDGERRLAPIASASTNDRGEYRLFALPPGMYYVKAAAGGGPSLMFIGMAEARGGPDSREAAKFAPAYFPGTPVLRYAQAIEVRAGADMGRIDLTLQPARAHKIRGTVIDGSSVRPPTTRATITLTTRDEGAQEIAARAASDADGHFEFNNVLPNSYLLTASIGRGAQIVMAGWATIEMNDADLDSVTVALSRGVNIPGRLVVEGTVPPSGNSHPIVVLVSRTAQATQSVYDAADFADATSFVIHDVPEDDYELSVTNLQPNQYLKSIRYGTADALNEGFHVDPRAGENLQVVIGTTSASIDGVVRMPNGESAMNVPVTLIPDLAHRQRQDLYKIGATTDDSGRFHFQDLAPGDYTLFAWEDLEEGWRDAEFIKRFESVGTPVHIGEVSGVTAQLRAVPAAY